MLCGRRFRARNLPPRQGQWFFWFVLVERLLLLVEWQLCSLSESHRKSQGNAQIYNYVAMCILLYKISRTTVMRPKVRISVHVAMGSICFQRMTKRQGFPRKHIVKSIETHCICAPMIHIIMYNLFLKSYLFMPSLLGILWSLSLKPKRRCCCRRNDSAVGVFHIKSGLDASIQKL